MKYVRAFIIALAIVAAWLVGWNKGFDVGELFGYQTAVMTAIKEGRIQVECKLINWEKHCKDVM